MTLSLSGAADVAQIAFAVFALLALGGAVWQTSSVRQSAREALTYNYFVRFANVEARRSLAMLLWINEGSDDESRRRFTDLSRAERLEALIIPNLCEELGGVYRHGMIEKKVARRAFGHTAHVLWNECVWLVEMAREEDPGYSRDWQNMLVDMGYMPAE